MSKPQLSWVGLRVDDLIVESLISDNKFSWVYQASTLDFASRCLLKVAKTADYIEPEQSSNLLASSARALLTGLKLPVIPDACELLKLQFEKLAEISHRGLVKPYKLFAEERLVYYQMPVLEGQTLSATTQNKSRSITLKLLAEICDLVHELSALGFAHGDLKPDNIILTADGPVLIDPGYFGPLNTDEGRYARVVVSTPAYYPSYQCDDLFALGIIVFESACKVHPFLLEQSESADNNRKGQAGTQLTALVKRYGITGNYNFKSLLNLMRPGYYLPQVTPELERLLLKALRLKTDSSGFLEPDPGFNSAAELAQEIRKLQNAGIEL